MNRWAFGALLSHWLRSPAQLFAIVVGLSLSTALWSAVQAINATARDSYSAAQNQLEQLGADRIVGADGPIPVADYVRLRRDGWQVSPVWDGRVTLGNTSINLIAIDFLSHPIVPDIIKSAAHEIGARSEGPAPILAQQPIFGAPATLKGLISPEHRTIAFEQLPPGILIADLAVANQFIDIQNLSYLVVLEDNKRHQSNIPDGLIWVSGADVSPGQLAESFHLNLTAFGLLAFVVGLFIVQSTIKLAVEQRRPLIRTLRALGLPLHRLILLCAFELAGFAVLAGSLGLVLGYILAGALLPGVRATVQGLYGSAIAGGLQMELSWVLWGLAMTVSGTAIAGGNALYQIYKTPILMGASATSGRQAGIRFRKLALRAGLLLLAVCPLLSLVPHIIAGFAVLGAGMLGSVLVMPSVLARVIHQAERHAQPGRMQWIWADMRMQLSALSVPLMALALAIATNIGVETMTSSFRLTFVEWINQRFSADLYVSVADRSDASDILAHLTQQDPISVRPLRTSDLPGQPHPTRVLGVVETSYYADHWTLLEQTRTPWDQLHASKGVMINEQLARGRGVWLGDYIALPQVGEIEVLGVYPDYGNPRHQIVMSTQLMARVSPGAPITNIAIETDDKQGVRHYLEKDLSIPGASVLDQSELRSQSLRVFDQTFVITAVLNVLTLAVASFALLTSFAALWDQRLPQLAPIWAMGTPIPSLARLEILRSLALAALTAVWAIPLGVMLAGILLSVTNVQAFGWKLPLFLFPLSWVRTILFALLAAALASVPSAIRLSRIQPVDLLRVFSRER